ncbi:MAG: clostripain-related cysteine peptidase [Treponema sp.]|nr:clostripain-related cysteine peptidase [Treponema sp.]MCL2237387.1 clostripain-related cysteine peptidase [Treponema sp.]
MIKNKRKTRFKIRFLFFLLILFILVCCKENDEETSHFAPATLIYMVADNNLDYYAIQNIRQMERGLPDDAEGPVFVFITRRIGATPSHPYLLKIEKNNEYNYITSPIIQTYPQRNTIEPNFLKQVIKDVKNHSIRYNAKLQRIVLWSHGTGWVPEGTPFNEIDYVETVKNSKNDVVNYSFGLDETGNGDGIEHSREMCIKDLAVALENERFELLIMDACFMGAIEVAYELRNIADFLILSPAEIVSSGFPYEEIIGCLSNFFIDPFEIALSFFNYYNNLTGALQTASISVVNTKYLTDLSSAMSSVYSDYALYENEISMDDYMQYDRTLSNYFFDFLNFVTRVSQYSQSDYYDVFIAYDLVLPLYLHTSKIFNMLDISETSGLSVYIPNLYSQRHEQHDYYKTLTWAKESNAEFLFN